jgi:ribosomal protein S1
MAKNTIPGKVTFVNHEKNYVMIEYDVNGKKKTIRGAIKPPSGKPDTKPAHNFMMGDEVNFNIGRADRSDKLVAANIEFKYNDALNNLIHKAQTTNQFKGYLKQWEEGFFVKEMDSYLFIPLSLSPWQELPAVEDLNEPVVFSLTIPKNKEKLSAQLLHPKFIPEYYKAQKLFKEEKIIEAVVATVKPHSIYLNIMGEAIQAKLPNDGAGYEAGQKIAVKISFLGPKKIVVEKQG